MKTKILFVNDEMRMGGVARVLLDLINHLSSDEYDIDVLILHPHGELLDAFPDYVNLLESDKFFDVVDISISEIIKQKNIILFIRKLLFFAYMKTGLINTLIKQKRKQLIKGKYDVELSAKEGFCTVFVAEGSARKKINWIQVDYSVFNYARNHQKLLTKALKKIDLNISSSIQSAESFKRLFGAKNFEVIHNFIDTETILRKSMEKVEFKKHDDFHFITVARFHPQKAVDRLVEAFKYVYDKNPNVFLTIIGDGDEREKIEGLIKASNLENSVELLGLKKNPYPYVRQADCFVLSSLYEGFATIVIETLVSTTPVLATQVAGINEQITQSEYGWVVDNTTEALQEKMLEISTQKKQIEKMKLSLEKYHYSNDEIAKQYHKIFND